MIFTNIEEVQDAFIITPQRYHDQRGYFQEHFNSETYNNISCQQISFSKSNKNVIRGIHCAQYGKLVQCVQGAIIDFVVDLRPESPTYLKWKSVELSHDCAKQVYIPPRCGHAIFSLEDDSLIVYCQGGVFDKDKEMNVNPFDPTINITWLELTKQDYVISNQDKFAPYVDAARSLWNTRNF